MYAGSGLAGGVLRLEWRNGKLAFADPEVAAFRLALEPTSTVDTFVAEGGSYFARGARGRAGMAQREAGLRRPGSGRLSPSAGADQHRRHLRRRRRILLRGRE